MRLRIYTAPTMAEAMRQVRAELGHDAIIVSTQREPNGKIRLSAALEPAPTEIPAIGGDASSGQDVLGRALAYHGIPLDIAGRILAAAERITAADPTVALGAALDEVFRFLPLADRATARPIMLVGPPGSGKTTTVAKLLARARLSSTPAIVVGADGKKPGAADGLAAIAEILETTFIAADTPGALIAARSAGGWRGLVVVDGPGINPFDENERTELEALVAAADAEPVLVLPAGLDPIEAAEIGEAFRSIRVRRMVTTRLDLARRLGSVIAAADGGEVMFADVTMSAAIADPTRALTPLALARLLLRDPLQLDQPLFDGEKAA